MNNSRGGRRAQRRKKAKGKPGGNAAKILAKKLPKYEEEVVAVIAIAARA